MPLDQSRELEAAVLATGIEPAPSIWHNKGTWPLSRVPLLCQIDGMKSMPEIAVTHSDQPCARRDEGGHWESAFDLSIKKGSWVLTQDPCSTSLTFWTMPLDQPREFETAMQATRFQLAALNWQNAMCFHLHHAHLRVGNLGPLDVVFPFWV